MHVIKIHPSLDWKTVNIHVLKFGKRFLSTLFSDKVSTEMKYIDNFTLSEDLLKEITTVVCSAKCTDH